MMDRGCDMRCIQQVWRAHVGGCGTGSWVWDLNVKVNVTAWGGIVCKARKVAVAGCYFCAVLCCQWQSMFCKASSLPQQICPLVQQQHRWSTGN